MVGDPLVAHPGEHDYELLHMPGHRQPQDAPECIYYALWVAIQYVANEYPDEGVREKTNAPKLDTIQHYIETGQNGWENVGQEPLTQISSEIGSLNLNLEYRYNGLPQDIKQFAVDGLDKLLPTIVFVDRLLLEQGERGEGPLHAVVICGADDSHITVEDPLVEGTTTLEIDNLDEAWDPEFNTAIEVRLRDGLEPTRRDEL
jgi:hypothetical protein